MTEILLYKAIVNDIPEMQALFASTVHIICAKDYTAEQRNVWADTSLNVDRWQKMLQEEEVLLAKINDELAGFCSLRKPDYIDMLYVHHLYQKKGVASALLSAIESIARNSGATSLTAEVSLTAQPFFLHNNFVLVKNQVVERKGVQLQNALMVKQLAV